MSDDLWTHMETVVVVRRVCRMLLAFLVVLALSVGLVVLLHDWLLGIGVLLVLPYTWYLEYVAWRHKQKLERLHGPLIEQLRVGQPFLTRTDNREDR